MKKDNGYVGQIGHGGTQSVKAPTPGKTNTCKGSVKQSGSDLRNKGGK